MRRLVVSEIMTANKTLLGSMHVVVAVTAVVKPAHRSAGISSAVAPLTPVFHSILSSYRSSADTPAVAVAASSARPHVFSTAAPMKEMGSTDT